MANSSGWSSQLPSGTSSLRDSDNQFRSHQSILEATLNSEHYFAASSATSAGVHQPGSARVFYGTRSSLVTPASADSAGRLFYATDTGALLYLGASSTSTLVGGTTPTSLGVVLSTTQGVSSGSWTQITLSKLTATSAGPVVASMSQAFSGDLTPYVSAASYQGVRIKKGSGVVAVAYAPFGNQQIVTVSGITVAALNDVFTVEVLQSSGTTQTTLTSNYFFVQRLP